MLYLIGRTLSVLCLLAVNVSVNILWFKISVILGIVILLAISYVVYKTVVFALEEKKQRNATNYEILNHLN